MRRQFSKAASKLRLPLQRNVNRCWLVLAALHRRLFRRVKLIGITGSCGKTTTTMLVSAVLSGLGPVRNGANIRGTVNHKILAKHIFAAGLIHGYCVVELSGHAQRTLHLATRYLRFNIGIVTHIKPDHRASYRSLEATALEKSQMVAGLVKTGSAILNTDDELVWPMRSRTRARVIGCGRSEDASLRLKDARATWPERLTLEIEHQDTPFIVQTRLLGEFATIPVLTALAVGITEGMDLAEAVTAVEAVEPVAGRMAPHITIDGVSIIDDSYKAPHYGVLSDLAYIREAKAKRKILVIGTMSDFSGSSSKRYRQVARQALEVADVVLFVGRWAASASKNWDQYGAERLRGFETTAACNAYLNSILETGDLLLLKGSTRMDHLERIVLDHAAPITCWRQRCKRRNRCNDCPDFGKTAASTLPS